MSPVSGTLFVNKSQVLVFNLNCNQIAKNRLTVGGSSTAPSVTISGASATDQFIVSVKYDTSAPVGSTARPTWTYTFGAGTASDTIVLSPKP